MFQCELAVEAPDGSPIFFKRQPRIDLPGLDEAYRQEAEMLAMIYRRHVEFAVGHGVAVHAEVAPDDADRAVRLVTRAIPSHEVPRTTPPTVEDADRNPAFAGLAGLVLDMKVLHETPQPQLRARLSPLVEAYRDWIDREEARIDDPAEGLERFRSAATAAIERCEATLRRIEEGLDLVATDRQVADAFRFMNQAMWLQRTRSLFSEGVRRGKDIDYNDVDIERNRSWYPFQLAFILLNLPGLAKLDHPDRAESPEAVADDQAAGAPTPKNWQDINMRRGPRQSRPPDPRSVVLATNSFFLTGSGGGIYLENCRLCVLVSACSPKPTLSLPSMLTPKLVENPLDGLD